MCNFEYIEGAMVWRSYEFSRAKEKSHALSSTRRLHGGKKSYIVKHRESGKAFIFGRIDINMHAWRVAVSEKSVIRGSTNI